MILEMEIKTLNVVMQALGAMPYVQVYEVVDSIKMQVQGQLTNQGTPPAGSNVTTRDPPWEDSNTSVN